MASLEKLTFGSYEVLQNPDGSPHILGEGSFGTTYKARHTLLGRISALKVIREDLLSRGSKEEQEETKRFLSEARAVSKLNHPGIASVYDCALDNGVFYYAMEFCDGGTLQDECEKVGPMAWAQVRTIALQIAAALDYAHTSGFLHRDIKPANIMLSGEGKSRQVKLIDFGLAKKFTVDTESSSATVRNDQENFRGNIATASPEQILEKELDQRSDLFSFGVTVWWLLIGKNPFGEMKRGPLIADRVGPLSYAPALPSNLEPEARMLLEGLLEKDVEQRIPSAHTVVESLDPTSVQSILHSPSAETPGATHIPQVESLDEPPDYEDGYSYGLIIATSSVAKLYNGKDLVTGKDVIAIVPDDSIDANALGGLRVAGHRRLNFGVFSILDWRSSGNKDTFVITKPEGCKLLDVLRKFGPARFSDALPFLGYLARSFDSSVAWTTFGIRVDPGEILVKTRGGDVDLAKFRSWSDLDSHSARCLPLLANHTDHGPTSEATLSTSAEEFPHLAQFAALVYRVIAGSAVKYAAFFTSGGYVMASGLSEDGNALIANTLCSPESYPSAGQFLQTLASLEAMPISGLTPICPLPGPNDIECGKLPLFRTDKKLVNIVSRGSIPSGPPTFPDNSISISDKVAELERKVCQARREVEEDVAVSPSISQVQIPLPIPVSTVVQTPPLPPVAPPTQKAKKLPIAAIAVVAIIGLGTAAWFVMSRQKHPVAPAPNTSSVDPVAPIPNTTTVSPVAPNPNKLPIVDPPLGTAGKAENMATVNVPGDVSTLTEALKICKPGGTIEIAGGTYAEAIILTKSVSLVAKSTAVFEDSGIGSSLITARGPIEVTLRNIQIKNTQRQAETEIGVSPPLVLITDGANVKFEGCVIEGSVGNGLSLADKAFASFSNCRIRQHRGYGINVSSGSKVKISLSEIQKSGRSGISATNVGSTVTLASGANVSDNSQNGVEVANGAELHASGAEINGNQKVGIIIEGSGSNARLEASCMISGNRKYGIGVINTGRLAMSEGTVENNSENGIYIESGGHAEIISSHFKSNGEIGVYLVGGSASAAAISKSTFESHSDSGAAFVEGVGKVSECHFINNPMAIFYGKGSSGSATGNTVQPGPVENQVVIENAGEVILENNTVGTEP